MSAPDEEGGVPMGPVLFPLNFPEVSIMYSILHERHLCMPPREEVMDEIERRELYPSARHVIPAAMYCVDAFRENMREYLVAFAGDKAVGELESRVEKTINRMKGK